MPWGHRSYWGTKQATREVREGPTTKLRYHDTDVVEFTPTHVRLNTGGYSTRTTKKRMNEAATHYGLDYAVHQKNFQWFVKRPGQKPRRFMDTITFRR